MPKKFRWSVVGIGVAVLIVGVLAVFYFYGWFLGKQERVLAGTARATFPYGDYSIAELEKMYPQYANVDVATTQTPEQTHRKFVDALKAGDINGAVECCFRKGDWESMKAGLERVKSENLLDEMIKDVDNNLEKDSVGDNSAAYSVSVMRDGKKFGHKIFFIKNSDGVWLIESL